MLFLQCVIVEEKAATVIQFSTKHWQDKIFLYLFTLKGELGGEFSSCVLLHFNTMLTLMCRWENFGEFMDNQIH